MPVAGPATTVPPPGTPPPPPTPPPNPTPVLDRGPGGSVPAERHPGLQARPRRRWPAASKAWPRRQAALQQPPPRRRLRPTRSSRRRKPRSAGATDRLRSLAVAAYMGVGYIDRSASATQPGGRRRDGRLRRPAPTGRSPRRPATLAGTVVGRGPERSAGAERDRGRTAASIVQLARTERRNGRPRRRSGPGGGRQAEAALTAESADPRHSEPSRHHPGAPAAAPRPLQPTGRPSVYRGRQDRAHEAVTGAGRRGDRRPTPAAASPDHPRPLGPDRRRDGRLVRQHREDRPTSPSRCHSWPPTTSRRASRPGCATTWPSPSRSSRPGSSPSPPYGQLTPKDNNFAGIGACDSCAHGWSFPTAQTGVRAQLELLEAYASPSRWPTPLLGPVGVGRCCPTWMALAGKWASSLVYGISIMTIYNQMLDLADPAAAGAAGLLGPGPSRTACDQAGARPAANRRSPPGRRPRSPQAASARQAGLVRQSRRHLGDTGQHPVIGARADRGLAVLALPRQIQVEGRPAVGALGGQRPARRRRSSPTRTAGMSSPPSTGPLACCRGPPGRSGRRRRSRRRRPAPAP